MGIFKHSISIFNPHQSTTPPTVHPRPLGFWNFGSSPLGSKWTSLKGKCSTHQTSWRHEAVERSLSESAGFSVPEKESDFNEDKELDAADRSNNELII